MDFLIYYTWPENSSNGEKAELAHATGGQVVGLHTR